MSNNTAQIIDDDDYTNQSNEAEEYYLEYLYALQEEAKVADIELKNNAWLAFK